MAAPRAAPGESPAPALLATLARLRRGLRRLCFAPPVACVYDPLDYARDAVRQYLERYACRDVEALLLGMNPGPYGMVQTGVPFGEVESVRGWLAIDAPPRRPRHEHPKRPILGLDCPRREVSGRRLWGLAQSLGGSPDRFFRRFFIWNYCPLAFLAESGRNLTPVDLEARERAALYAPCDRALAAFVRELRPRRVIGIGRFAADRARAALRGSGPPVGEILHPSPASPAANRGWEEQARRQLRALGVALRS